MVSHARTTYPNECCGAMLGSIDGDEQDCPRRGRRSRTRSRARRARGTSCGREDLLRADAEARRQRAWT